MMYGGTFRVKLDEQDDYELGKIIMQVNKRFNKKKKRYGKSNCVKDIILVAIGKNLKEDPAQQRKDETVKKILELHKE